jgi:hypothetical protein
MWRAFRHARDVAAIRWDEAPPRDPIEFRGGVNSTEA